MKKRGNTGNLSATRAHADAIRAQDRLIRRRESQTVTCEVWDGLLLFASNPGKIDLALQVIILDSEGAARRIRHVGVIARPGEQDPLLGCARRRLITHFMSDDRPKVNLRRRQYRRCCE